MAFSLFGSRKRAPVRVLSLFLVAVMIWGLLPLDAAALEPICGIEEHVHDETCHAVYGDNILKCRAGEYLHVHDNSCYDGVGNLACYYADFYMHKHSADQGCYDGENNLVCVLEEYDESIHEDIYYSSENVTCVYAPKFGHVHGSSCYEIVSNLTCNQEQDPDAHRHDDSCYENVLTCGLEETEIDAGDSDTGESDTGASDGGEFDTGASDESASGDGTLDGSTSDEGVVSDGDIVTIPVSDENDSGDVDSGEDYVALGHIHDVSCYTRELTCGMLEAGHIHDGSCYESVQNLICDVVPDSASSVSGDVCHHYTYDLHTHGSYCFDKDGHVVCNKWEIKSHTHDSICFEKQVLSYDNPELVCNKDEHKHGLSCYFKEKTEELEAFLSGYEALKSAIDSGEYDLESEEGKQAVADAAWTVKQLGLTLDKDVLKLDSVKEMMVYLDGLIPEGYSPDDSENLDTIISITPRMHLSFEGEEPESFWVTVGAEYLPPADGDEPNIPPDFEALGYPFTVRTSGWIDLPAIVFPNRGRYDVKFWISECSPNVTEGGRKYDMGTVVHGSTGTCDSPTYFEYGDWDNPHDADYGMPFVLKWNDAGVFTPVVDMRYIGRRLSGGIPVTIDAKNMYPSNLEGQAIISDYPVTVSSPGLSELPEIYFPEDDIYYVDISMSVPDGSYGLADDAHYMLVVEYRDGVCKSSVYYQRTPDGHSVRDENGKEITFSKDEGFRFVVRPSPDVMYDFSPSVKAQAREIMSTMSRKEKLGQMVMADANAGDVRTMVETYGIGGLLLFQAHCTYDWNGDGKELGERVAEWQLCAGRIPLMISVDEEGGDVNRVSHPNTVDRNDEKLRDEPFKADSKIYAQNNSFVDVQLNAIEKGQFLKKHGVNVNYAPSLDVADTGYMGFLPDGSIDGAHRGRAFSGDAFLVSEYAGYALNGQRLGGVGSVVKHFPGYTNTSDNTHAGESSIISTEFEAEHKDLLPFYAAMADGAGMVMVTHNNFSWLDPGVCSSLSSKAYELARRMGFNGVMITDDLNMKAVTLPYGERGLAALQAGADVAMVADILDVEGVINASESDLSDARVDESVLRILCYKIENGIIKKESGEVPPVSDGEAEYIDSDGLFGGTGSFESMWEKVMLFGGTVRLLQDCDVESVQLVSDRSITLDLNGHELHFVGTGIGFNVSNSAARPFVIKDSLGVASVDCAELTDFVKQNPRTTSSDGMLSGVWDIDYSNRVAKWQSVDAVSECPVEYTLDLSESGGIMIDNGCVLNSFSKNAFVRFESGYIQTSPSCSESVVIACNPMSLTVTGGWFFGCHSAGSIISMGNDSSVEFLGGGIVGSNTGELALSSWGRNNRVVLNDVHVSANIAMGGSIGAIGSSGSLEIRNSDISSNHGNHGAICVSSGSLADLDDSVVSFNRSLGNGGGLEVSSGVDDFSVGASLFAYNSAKDNGGAMYLEHAGTVSGHMGSDVPVRFLHNCATTGGGVYVERVYAGEALTDFDFVRFDGNEAVTGGGLAIHGYGYLCDFSDILIENSNGVDLSAIYANFLVSASTDKNVRFHNLTVRDCSVYDNDSDKYVMNLRSYGTFTELSGLISLDESVTMKPFSENTMYLLHDDFDISSRIPIKAGFVVPLTAPVRLVGVIAGSSFDLRSAVSCFVPDDAHKVWYDANQNAIMYGDINYNQGSSATGEGVQIEYFANIDLVDESSSANSYQIAVIDDTKYMAGSMKDNGGGYLPLNKYSTEVKWNTPDEDQLSIFSKIYPVKPVFLSRKGSENRFVVNSHMVLTELYRPAYVSAVSGLRIDLSSDTVNRFSHTSDGFSVAQIWVHDDRVALADILASDVSAYTNPDNFRVYVYSDGLYLTSDLSVAESDPEHAIFVTDSSLVRFVADSVVSTDLFHAVFYDYNMTSGEPISENTYQSYESGIHSDSNYANGSDKAHRYAFGNSNGTAGSGYGNNTYLYGDVWGAFNKANIVLMKNETGDDVRGRTFYGTAFGVVQGLDSNGDLRWNKSISPLRLFNEPGASETVGRKVFANSSLVFRQEGNMFMLQGVAGPDGEPSISHDLTEFFNPGQWNGTNGNKRIFTNNFWPMDAVSDYDGKDPLCGDSVTQFYGNWSDNADDMTSNLTPRSDDDVPHNAYFGMHFSVEFDLYDDYVGPMMYYFFGDDDMWVFLDGKLILDIGGVHSSAGQYVDLRNYLPVKDVEDITSGYTTHKLTVYYTERGASGSTCWMRFRLPTPLRVTTDTPDDVVTYGNVSVEKRISGYSGDNLNFPVEFTFKSGSGLFASELDGSFEYFSLDGHKFGDVKSGDVLVLTAGEPIVIKQLPVGSVVSVKEKLDGDAGFDIPGRDDRDFWTLIDDESTLKTEIQFGDRNNLTLKNVYNDKCELRITKSVVDGDNQQMDCVESFSFRGEFRVNGVILSEPLLGFVCPIGVDPDTANIGNTIQIYSNETFVIPANSVVYIKSAPANLQYNVWELPGDAERLGFALVGNPQDSNGLISVGGIADIIFVNAPIGDMPKLPFAGGYGVFRYTISGLALLGFVAIQISVRKNKSCKA